MSLAELQGEWKVVEATESGKTARNPSARLVISGSCFARVTPQHTYTRDITVNDETNPPEIELLLTNDPGKGEVFFGIYEIEGERLTICHSMPGRPRPKDFSSTSENGNVLSVSVRMQSK